MTRLLSCAALATMLLAGAACTSTSNSNMDTQSGGSTATPEKTERGVKTLPAE